MADYPRTLMEQETRFATEDAWREYLVRLRWFNRRSCRHRGKAFYRLLEQAWRWIHPPTHRSSRVPVVAEASVTTICRDYWSEVHTPKGATDE